MMSIKSFLVAGVAVFCAAQTGGCSDNTPTETEEKSQTKKDKIAKQNTETEGVSVEKEIKPEEGVSVEKEIKPEESNEQNKKSLLKKKITDLDANLDNQNALKDEEQQKTTDLDANDNQDALKGKEQQQKESNEMNPSKVPAPEDSKKAEQNV